MKTLSLRRSRKTSNNRGIYDYGIFQILTYGMLSSNFSHDRRSRVSTGPLQRWSRGYVGYAERSGAERSGANQSESERSGAERSEAQWGGAHWGGAGRSGAQWGGAERSGAERSGAERIGSERSGAEFVGAERIGAERIGAERNGAERIGAERSGVERSGVGRSGVERSGVERSGVERMFFFVHWSGGGQKRPTRMSIRSFGKYAFRKDFRNVWNLARRPGRSLSRQ